MNHNEDQRIIRTRAVIKDAFFKLLAEKPFEKITVADITEAALIHRGTFYSHYKDKYDMVSQIENELIEQLGTFISTMTAESVNTALTAHKPFPHLIPALTYIEENPEPFILIAKLDYSMKFYQKLNDRYFDYAMKAFRFPQDKWLSYRRDILGAFVASIFSRWVLNGMKEPKEELALWITEQTVAHWSVYFEK